MCARPTQTLRRGLLECGRNDLCGLKLLPDYYHYQIPLPDTQPLPLPDTQPLRYFQKVLLPDTPPTRHSTIAFAQSGKATRAGEADSGRARALPMTARPASDRADPLE